MKYVITILVVLLNGCEMFSSNDQAPSLKLIKSSGIDVSEPSGLTLDASNKFFYCVSDPPENKVHKLDLDGNLVQTLGFVGQDLEGISFDPRDGSLWVVDELQSEFIHLSDSGEELSRTALNYSVPEKKNGLEGICFRPETQDIHIIKQKNPAAVIYVDSNLVTQNSKSFDLSIDITGICQGRGDDEFLIISAGEKQLFEWSWEGGILATYRFDVKQAEGVIYDTTSALVYIVCDSESILYTYKFPD